MGGNTGPFRQFYKHGTMQRYRQETRYEKGGACEECREAAAVEGRRRRGVDARIPYRPRGAYRARAESATTPEASHQPLPTARCPKCRELVPVPDGSEVIDALRSHVMERHAPQPTQEDG